MKKKALEEKTLEKKLTDGIKKLGGAAIKYTSPYYIGMPDRLVLLPSGVVCFVELKSETGRLTPIQVKRHAQLSGLNQKVFIVRDATSLQNCLSAVAQL